MEEHFNMEKIFTSELSGWDESADRVHIYEFKSEEDYKAACNMPGWKIVEELGYRDTQPYCPGGQYERYSGEFCGKHFIVTETVALDV